MMRPIEAELLSGTDLYQRVVLERLARARESVTIATANVKEMYIHPAGASPSDKRARFRSILDLFSELAARGVALRLLHADLPSRPFRAAFDKKKKLVAGGLALKICPRVHFKAVLVDGAWLYLGSANLTGAGLGAKDARRRNFELGFVTEDFDTIDRVSALFESVWSGAECGACRLRDICPDPIGPIGPAEEKPRPSLVQLGRARRIARDRPGAPTKGWGGSR